MKIFLIQPKTKGAFKTPCLGLQLIATVLKQNSYDNIYDIDPEKGDNPYSQDYTGSNVIIGMTITFMTFSEAVKLAEYIKSKNKNVTIIFGGPHVTLVPDESITQNCVDIIVIREGIFTMTEIVNALRDGKTLKNIKGIWYKDSKNKIIKTPPREFIKDLDTIPYADRSFFNDRKYFNHQYSFMERLLLPCDWSLMSAYSCPYSCKMCQPALREIAGPWRQRSVLNVINEIKILKEKYNAKFFTFYDNDMGINRKWMKEFCQETKKIKNIHMNCCGRANLMDYEMLRDMKEAGFATIAFGAESGNNRVLKEIMNKKTTVKNIIDFAHNCFKLKIKVNAFWMIANPGETIDEMKETAHLASELPVFYCHFHVANPNPGTEYYNNAKKGGYLNLKSWDDVHNRKTPTIIKNNVSRQEIIDFDKYLIDVMVKKGWNYRYNGHTLSFVNTRIYAKRFPLKVFGNEIRLFLKDFKPYHLKNIFLGIRFIIGLEKLKTYNDIVNT